MSQFNILTSLNLDKLPIQCRNITSILGKSCPQLKWLRIGFANYSLTTDDLLSVFYSGDLDTLNEAAQDLPSTNKFGDLVSSEFIQKAYHQCLVPAHLLHPFCQTLEEIRINHYESGEPYVIAFILRHLPRLKQLETSDFEFKDYSASIRALWDIRESTAMEATMCIPSDSSLITISSFTGLFFSSYVHTKYNSLDCRNIGAIASFCWRRYGVFDSEEHLRPLSGFGRTSYSRYKCLCLYRNQKCGKCFHIIWNSQWFQKTW